MSYIFLWLKLNLLSIFKIFAKKCLPYMRKVQTQRVKPHCIEFLNGVT